MSSLNKKLLSIPGFLLLLMVVACHPSNYMFEQFAQEEKGWVLLGEKKVNHLHEKDILKVKRTDKVTSLRLYIRDRNVTINDLQIHLVNGDVLQPAIEKEVKRGERSSIVELAADGRQLDYIVFRYRSKGAIFTKRGTVLIVGKTYTPNGTY